MNGTIALDHRSRQSKDVLFPWEQGTRFSFFPAKPFFSRLYFPCIHKRPFYPFRKLRSSIQAPSKQGSFMSPIILFSFNAALCDRVIDSGEENNKTTWINVHVVTFAAAKGLSWFFGLGNVVLLKKSWGNLLGHSFFMNIFYCFCSFYPNI